MDARGGKKKVAEISLTAEEARKYFLEPKNYLTVPLPEYFDFGPVLSKTARAMEGKSLAEFCDFEKMAKARGVNFKFYSRKSEDFAAREFTIVHPAVYVEMVRILTEDWERIKTRMRIFARQGAVMCASVMPGARGFGGGGGFNAGGACGGGAKNDAAGSAILKWWHGMEQASLKMALYYNYMAETDVADCYKSVSFDLVARAVGGEAGRCLSRVLAAAENGRSAGLPQGSAMGDFLAEMVLGYLDVRFYCAVVKAGLKMKPFSVLRYRDDYRIFAKDLETVRQLIRILAEVLEEAGLRLNVAKTKIYDDIVATARKPDKVYWEELRARASGDDVRGVGGGSGFGFDLSGAGGSYSGLSVQKRLLMIYELGRKFPNSGSVQRAMVELHKDAIFKIEKRPSDAYQLLGILANIMVENPRTCQVAVAAMSKIMSFNPGISRNALVEAVLFKARRLPDADYFEIWLQRLTVKNKRGKKFSNGLSRMLYEPGKGIWNSEWVGKGLDSGPGDAVLVDANLGAKRLKICDADIVVPGAVKRMPFVMPTEELDLFAGYDGEEDWFEEFDFG